MDWTVTISAGDVMMSYFYFRKVVIGFAFMVPDVKYNEAYISFLFTHPEWRFAGIAKFMVYHLIQVSDNLALGLLHYAVMQTKTRKPSMRQTTISMRSLHNYNLCPCCK
jgi:GNAT superfamily N-acetyltransferase